METHPIWQDVCTGTFWNRVLLRMPRTNFFLFQSEIDIGWLPLYRMEDIKIMTLTQYYLDGYSILQI